MAENNINIFDRKIKILHRNCLHKMAEGQDFLLREVAERIIERLDEDLNRSFPIALEIGSGNGIMSDMLKGKAGIEKIIKSDISSQAIQKLKSPKMVFDEEFLPFKEKSFDIILSNLCLHWVNDLPGALIQINRALKDSGVFIATMFGAETLRELKESMTLAEIEYYGGTSPRISPFVEVKDAGALLQRAKFALPVADSDKITVNYKNVWSLMHDLRAMGESNALIKRRKNFTARGFFDFVDKKYRELFADESGKIPASFEIVTITGWKS